MKIFLDLDGTILNPKFRLYRLYYNLLTTSGYSTMDITAYWRAKRARTPEYDIALNTTTKEFAYYYEERRLDFIEHMDYLSLDRHIPGAVEKLTVLAEEHDLYLLTMRHDNENLYKQLSLFNLKNHFKDIYVCADKLRILGHKVDEGSINVEDSVIVGDTELDIVTGQNLGIKTVAVCSGMRNKKYLKKFRPDIIIESIKDLKI
jgi:phosphoglycolate phosphatase